WGAGWVAVAGVAVGGGGGGGGAWGFGALLVFAAAGPAYNAFAWPLAEEGYREGLRDATGVQRLAMEKGWEIAQSASDAIVGGLARRALAFVGIAALGIGAAALWPRVKETQEKQASPPVPEPAGTPGKD
ncbi:MAG: hypothetical protein HY532_06135, partial [Chloroflexi bacterium]|nr:hypothetical protein [Chloroflexota bacterium]